MAAIRQLFSYIYLISILFIQINNASIFDYFLPKRDDKLNGNELDLLPSVPFEISERDEKFIQEGAKLIGTTLSKLDSCHHRVILTLKKTCNEMNAEQMGKLSVMLLNCQSESEGRIMFQCTDAMSLKDCTIHMDSDTWNAYHLITNRAKAVCSAVRQEQFRGLTEMTVNKLMNTAQEQINLMNQVAESQEHLQLVTSTAIDELSGNNLKLINQQQEMLKISDNHRSTVESNLHELMREKSLIKAGQFEVSQLIGHLRIQLDEGIDTIRSQTKQTRQNHADLLTDLKNLHRNALDISEKLAETMEYVLTQTELASGQFDQTMKQLNDINKTIFELAEFVNKLQDDLDTKLNWIVKKVGGTDNFLHKINVVLIHVGYLLLGMLILVFVNSATFYRIFLVLAVAVNFATSILDYYHLDAQKFPLMVVTVFFGNFIRNIIMQNISIDGIPEETKRPTIENNIDEIDNNNTLINRTFTNLSRSAKTPVNKSFYNIERNEENRSMTPASRFLKSELDNRSRSGTPYSVTMGERIRCNATTMKGEQCRHASMTDGIYCRIHNRG